MKNNKLPAIGALALLLLIGVTSIAASRSDAKILNKVVSGHSILKCHFKDGMRTVNPDMIEGFQDGIWVFSNGHSKSCMILEAK